MTTKIIVHTLGGNWFDSAKYINSRGLAKHVVQFGDSTPYHTNVLLKMTEEEHEKFMVAGVLRRPEP